MEQTDRSQRGGDGERQEEIGQRTYMRIRIATDNNVVKAQGGGPRVGTREKRG